MNQKTELNFWQFWLFFWSRLLLCDRRRDRENWYFVLRNWRHCSRIFIIKRIDNYSTKFLSKLASLITPTQKDSSQKIFPLNNLIKLINVIKYLFIREEISQKLITFYKNLFVFALLRHDVVLNGAFLAILSIFEPVFFIL